MNKKILKAQMTLHQSPKPGLVAARLMERASRNPFLLRPEMAAKVGPRPAMGSRNRMRKVVATPDKLLDE